MVVRESPIPNLIPTRSRRIRRPIPISWDRREINSNILGSRMVRSRIASKVSPMGSGFYAKTQGEGELAVA